MASTAEHNFVRQQGFPDAPTESGHARYSGLLFQPRALGVSFANRTLSWTKG